jgi:hypothetical protein
LCFVAAQHIWQVKTIWLEVAGQRESARSTPFLTLLLNAAPNIYAFLVNSNIILSSFRKKIFDGYPGAASLTHGATIRLSREIYTMLPGGGKEA